MTVLKTLISGYLAAAKGRERSEVRITSQIFSGILRWLVEVSKTQSFLVNIIMRWMFYCKAWKFREYPQLYFLPVSLGEFFGGNKTTLILPHICFSKYSYHFGFSNLFAVWRLRYIHVLKLYAYCLLFQFGTVVLPFSTVLYLHYVPFISFTFCLNVRWLLFIYSYFDERKYSMFSCITSTVSENSPTFLGWEAKQTSQKYPPLKNWRIRPIGEMWMLLEWCMDVGHHQN